MQSTKLLVWIFFFILGLVTSQPLFGLEKQLLYSFQDPDEFEVLPQKRSHLLNLIGSNSRFTNSYGNAYHKKMGY